MSVSVCLCMSKLFLIFHIFHPSGKITEAVQQRITDAQIYPLIGEKSIKLKVPPFCKHKGESCTRETFFSRKDDFAQTGCKRCALQR